MTQAAVWRRELAARPAPKRAAQLKIWQGEWELARDEQPDLARRDFRQAQALAHRAAQTPADRMAGRHLFGLAAYDSAIALYYGGAFRDAADAFHGLSARRTLQPGYDLRSCTLWYRHAAACAGLHADHARLGIPEPTRLDPLCGVAAVAASLQSLGLPSDRKTLLSDTRVTGEGSTLRDLIAAGPKLGVRVRPVTADERGLRALPKPLVAFVESDHFVSVIRADARGVSYLCSDCGMWPGGEVRLTWKQWNVLNPGVYATVTRPGSPWDRTLAAALGESVARVASAGSLAGLRPAQLRVLTPALARLRGHVTLDPAVAVGCGIRTSSLKCQCYIACPYIAPGSSMKPQSASSAGDPVNAATGEEEYAPPTDLTVYNPHGPSVAWGRTYDSLRPSFGSNPYYPTTFFYESDDFGEGWTNPYNGVVYDTGVTEPATNPQVMPGYSRSFPPAGSDAPGAGLTWDVVRGGATVATSATPNGWTVSDAYGSLVVTAPASATVAAGYEVRYSGGVSGAFDVVTATGVPQGATGTLTPTGSDVPAGGDRWDVVYNGTVIASRYQPNGWSGDIEDGECTVTVPSGASVGGGYELRVFDADNTMAGYSCPFMVIPTNLVPHVGTKNVMDANGAIVPAAAASVPSAAHPVVHCTVPAGAPMLVDWDYDSATPYGHYVITYADRTRWLMRPGGVRYAYTYGSPNVLLGVFYQVSQIADRNGNALTFTYGPGSTDDYSNGMPLLANIRDASNGTALLTLQRDSTTGAVTSVSDAYGRSVYYRCTPLAQGSPVASLTQVSQIVPVGTTGAPMRYAYGYTTAPASDEGSSYYFLGTISVPSPTGTGTSTTTISYSADNAASVVKILDQNNAETDISYTDGSHTRATFKDGSGNTLYTYSVAFNSDMSQTGSTDGRANPVYTVNGFATGTDPYRPSSTTDGNGRTTGYTWDQYGNLLTETPPSNSNRTPAVTTNTYDYTRFALGELTQTQTGGKGATSYTYDDQPVTGGYAGSGLCLSVTGPQPGTVGGTGTVTAFYAYDLTAYSNAGAVTHQGLGNLLSITAPGNNATGTITTAYGYTTDGGYSQPAAIGQVLTVTDNLGKVTHFRYDGRGNRTSVTDALGNEYDSTYNVADQPLTTADPATGQTGNGRAVRSAAYLYPDGPMTGVTSYDEGNTAGPIRQITYAYGPEGETLGLSGSTEPVTYTYDALYRLSALTDGGGHATHYYYKRQGYLDAMTYPGYAGPAPAYSAASDGYANVTGADSVRFPSYDADGNALTRIDGNGVTTTYTHSADPRSLLTLIHYAYPSGYAGAQIADVSLAYDAYGRSASETDTTGTHDWAYDDRDAVTAAGTQYSGLGRAELDYAFYPDGSRRTMAVNNGSSYQWTHTYGYDADGRLTSLSNNATAAPGAWAYYDNGWLQSRRTGVGGQIQTGYAYNARGQVTDQSVTNANGPLADYGNQTHDGVGDRIGMSVSMPQAPASFSGTTAYVYDAKSQLTQEQSTRNGGYTQGFGYDGAGNPTTFRGQAVGAASADNQAPGAAYDGDGNPTTYGGRSLSFDPEGRLTSCGGVMTAAYDAWGRRAWKADGTGYQNGNHRTYFLYDGILPVVEQDSAGVVGAEDTWGADGLVTRATGYGPVDYAFDPSGTAAARISGYFDIVASGMSDGFGRVTTSAEANQPRNVGDPYGGFGGQWGGYTDQETGLVLFGHRYYDPETGRFLTRDPAGYGGGVNLYTYTRNNPVNRSDPRGLYDSGGPGFGKPGDPTDGSFPDGAPEDWPTPPENIPGGPWNWKRIDTDKRGGKYVGPTGGRGQTKLTWSGPKHGGEGYWKCYTPRPGGRGSDIQQRYNPRGEPISAREAHPGPAKPGPGRGPVESEPSPGEGPPGETFEPPGETFEPPGEPVDFPIDFFP